MSEKEDPVLVFRGRFVLLTAVLLSLVLVRNTVEAQVLYGAVVGAVKDAQGASIPAATVTITNKETNLTRETITGAEGDYTVTNVPPGHYDVKVTLTGFREFVQTNVPVSAGQLSRVDVKLEIGALTETVTVASDAQLLQTDKSDLHTELRSKEITNLPLNQYRNYQALINLVPGATPATFQNAQTDTPGRSLRTNINGADGQNNNTRIDGASSVNIWLPHHTGYVAPAETIETVNIATNNFDAAQGMAGGASITVVTKSGTNAVKGSAFYFRNQDELNATGFFTPSCDVTPPPSCGKLNSSITIGGGTVGGPIRKNKLFFFAAYEGNYERNSRYDMYSVPTAKMRNGDFSEERAINPNFHIYDPTTGNADGTGRTEFPDGKIPADRISSLSKQIQALYPAPNNPGTNSGLQNNLYIPRSPKADRDNYDFKMDWNRTNNHRIFAKFSTLRAKVSDIFKLGYDPVGFGDTKIYVPTVGHTWTLSPTMVMDGTVGMNKQDQFAKGGDFGTNFGSETFGIPGTNGPDPLQSGMPQFRTGYSELGNNDTWVPVERHETSYTVTTNLTRLMGRHEMRVGFDFIRYQLDHWQPELGDGPRGAFNFSGNITGQPGYTSNLWNQYAGFLLGLDSGYGKSVQFETMTGRENQYATFISDRWNVSSKMTVNAGLRYEYYPLMSRANHGIERLDYATWTVLIGGKGNVPEDVGVKVSKTLFAPRSGHGLPDQRQDRVPNWLRADLRSDSVVATAPPLLSLDHRIRPDGGRHHTWREQLLLFPACEWHPEHSAAGYQHGRDPDAAQRHDANAEPDRGRARTVAAVECDARATGGFGRLGQPGVCRHAYRWRLRRYQRQLRRRRRRLMRAVSSSHRPARLTSSTGPDARSRRYNALQSAINRPFKNGLLLKGAYTWSKAMDETDDDGWVTLDVEPAVPAQSQLRAGRLRQDPQFLDGLPVRSAVCEERHWCPAGDRPKLAGQRRLPDLLRHAVLD